MKRAFEKVKPDSRIIIGYSASLFLLLVVYVVSLVANNQLKERASRVEHTYKVIFDLEALISKMKDAETGVRGYAITKNDDFLEPYYPSAMQIDSIYKRLMISFADNKLQQQRLSELKNECDKRFTIFKDFISYTKNGQVDTNYKVVPVQMEAKRTMNRIRNNVIFMQGEENKLLAERDAELKSTFSSINTITITSLLLTLVLVIIGFVTYTAENKARKVALQNIKDYQEQLNNRIDELNTANAQLLQMRSMEKFAATGRIARTIAHEVRNPLTNIDLASSQLKADLDSKDEGLNYYFDVMERNSARINKLISDLLQSTKFSELNFSTIAVNKLLDDTLTQAKDRIELNNIKVEKNYLNNNTVLAVDEEKIKIAFLNIIINAIEAMPAGKGKLIIATKIEKDNLHIIMSDNGSGMDAGTLNNLFEPYFTSKKNGNGLGLANTQNIIFNHKGTINVTSKPGIGSTFTIILPV